MILLDKLRWPLVCVRGNKVHCALAETAQVLAVYAVSSDFHHQAESSYLRTCSLFAAQPEMAFSQAHKSIYLARE